MESCRESCRGRNSRARKAENNESRATENQVFAPLDGHSIITPLNIDVYLRYDEPVKFNRITSCCVSADVKTCPSPASNLHISQESHILKRLAPHHQGGTRQFRRERGSCITTTFRP
jgi:hypothetical protein